MRYNRVIFKEVNIVEKANLKSQIESLVELYNKENNSEQIEIVSKKEIKSSNVEVSVATNKCTNGLFFYTTIKNKSGEIIHPFESEELWKVLNEAMAYASVLGVPVNQYLANEWVTEEQIKEAYVKAEDML